MQNEPKIYEPLITNFFLTAALNKRTRSTDLCSQLNTCKKCVHTCSILFVLPFALEISEILLYL